MATYKTKGISGTTAYRISPPYPDPNAGGLQVALVGIGQKIISGSIEHWSSNTNHNKTPFIHATDGFYYPLKDFTLYIGQGQGTKVTKTRTASRSVIHKGFDGHFYNIEAGNPKPCPTTYNPDGSVRSSGGYCGQVGHLAVTQGLHHGFDGRYYNMIG